MNERKNVGMVGRVKERLFEYLIVKPLLMMHEVGERIKACDYRRRGIDFVYSTDDLFNLPKVYRTYRDE